MTQGCGYRCPAIRNVIAPATASCQRDRVIEVGDSCGIEMVLENVIDFVVQTFDQVHTTIATASLCVPLLRRRLMRVCFDNGD